MTPHEARQEKKIRNVILDVQNLKKFVTKEIKITQLTEKTAIALTDLMIIADMSESTPSTKKCTVAHFLVSLRIRVGENDSDNVAATTPWAVVFTSPIGSAVNGSDYDLIISSTDALESTELVGYVISARTQNGFTISVVDDAWVEYTAILK